MNTFLVFTFTLFHIVPMYASFDTNKELLDYLQRTKTIKSQRIYDIMFAVDRANYTLKGDYYSYGDHPIGIGHGATISAPHMHAMALSYLEDHLKEGAHALDVGSGSGYVTACMALMVGKRGCVVGIDHIKELIDMSVHNFKRDRKTYLLATRRVRFIVGDGRKGYKLAAPYDAIHVGAAVVDDAAFEALKQQMRPGGRLILPFHDVYKQVDKNLDGTYTETDIAGVRFIPLTDPDKQTGGRRRIDPFMQDHPPEKFSSHESNSDGLKKTPPAVKSSAVSISQDSFLFLMPCFVGFLLGYFIPIWLVRREWFRRAFLVL